MKATRYAVIALAGDRGPDDPVARATGAPCKALSPVAGTPLIWRLVDTLKQMDTLGPILMVGPSRAILAANPTLEPALADAGIRWIEPGDSPSISATRALAELEDDQPAIITTADHALLRPSMIGTLLQTNGRSDLTVGMIAYAQVLAAYPASRRTAIRLRPAPGYCGCNLFAVHTMRGRQLVERWRAVEAQRKHPARVVIGMLGWRGVVRYALGRLTLSAAFARLSARTGVRVAPALLTEPEAAIDVDSVADLELVESILAQRSAAAGG